MLDKKKPKGCGINCMVVKRAATGKVDFAVQPWKKTADRNKPIIQEALLKPGIHDVNAIEIDTDEIKKMLRVFFVVWGIGFFKRLWYRWLVTRVG